MAAGTLKLGPQDNVKSCYTRPLLCNQLAFYVLDPVSFSAADRRAFAGGG